MIAPHGTGHIRTVEDGVMRVDFERGRWVATRSSARHVMPDQLYGSALMWRAHRDGTLGGRVVEPDALAEPQNSEAGKGNSR
jgi:hypothetical protein